MPAVTEQEILAGLGEIIEEIVGIPAAEVTPEKSFIDDLDIDSLSMVEIAVAAQDKFGVEIPDDELRNLKTVKDVINYVQNLSGATKA
ncbi:MULTISPECIES: acyl carrier protein [Thermomonospora]|uniref:Acyl carrier protein n=1 Tax=Thermomonospora curvata (strain ATCC 19995 / DSM 43183 / JCM 3096 / KCTC 9072 / NBRC 15933 / NCIMB 10081 / Henssen B9) TaxID=471852 RepID=D1ABH9_THECD|nr:MULTISPECIES: acyl carrier protein [Thermomonospora]ACY97215.1 phosphopantetheine-binding protein [Thermomonospora curvata DSM 43183]PKK15064.1 MAG: acyl carrier protein [Thermomonospora sp. CIF 1]